jgi:hypothetical protein
MVLLGMALLGIVLSFGRDIAASSILRRCSRIVVVVLAADASPLV